MSPLLDTHLLLWALYQPERLPPQLRQDLENPDCEVWFSAANIWEIAIKKSLGKPDFTADPFAVRAEALRLGFNELTIDGLQAAGVLTLPSIHADPFDRILLAQAIATGHTLLTSDVTLATYPGPIRRV